MTNTTINTDSKPTDPSSEKPELCHCGQPLHYTDPTGERIVKMLVGQLGPEVTVTVGGRSYAVPRHFLALHGLEASEIHLLGFKEIVK